jgi:type III restriction enzyme
MSLLVDNPILNSPFEEPARYWAYEEGQPVLKEGRRPAGYYLKPRTRGPQTSLFEEEFVRWTWSIPFGNGSGRGMGAATPA